MKQGRGLLAITSDTDSQRHSVNLRLPQFKSSKVKPRTKQNQQKLCVCVCVCHTSSLGNDYFVLRIFNNDEKRENTHLIPTLYKENLLCFHLEAIFLS